MIFWVFFLVPWAIGWITGNGRPVAVGASLTIFVTFVLFEAAYYAEIVRAGFRSISTGQYAACDALGLSKLHAYIYVLFPQAFRNVLPILLTQTIVLFQDTSLVYVISATDLLRRGHQDRPARRPSGRNVSDRRRHLFPVLLCRFAVRQTVAGPSCLWGQVMIEINDVEVYGSFRVLNIARPVSRTAKWCDLRAVRLRQEHPDQDRERA